MSLNWRGWGGKQKHCRHGPRVLLGPQCFVCTGFWFNWILCAPLGSVLAGLCYGCWSVLDREDIDGVKMCCLKEGGNKGQLWHAKDRTSLCLALTHFSWVFPPKEISWGFFFSLLSEKNLTNVTIKAGPLERSIHHVKNVVIPFPLNRLERRNGVEISMKIVWHFFFLSLLPSSNQAV